MNGTFCAVHFCDPAVLVSKRLSRSISLAFHCLSVILVAKDKNFQIVYISLSLLMTFVIEFSALHYS